MSKFLYWLKYGFFLYYKSHLSKFLYFESYKFWKLANIKVSMSLLQISSIKKSLFGFVPNMEIVQLNRCLLAMV